MKNAEVIIENRAEIIHRMDSFLAIQEDREVQEDKHKGALQSRMNWIGLVIAALTLFVAYGAYDRQFNEPIRTQTAVEHVYHEHELGAHK